MVHKFAAFKPLSLVPPRLSLRTPHGRLLKAKNEDQPEGDRLDEEAVEKLRKAEEETERLRRELATIRARQEKETMMARAGRTLWAKETIDSKDLKRETMNDLGGESGNWLSETDVDFLIGNEADSKAMTPEERDVVNRRLAVGGLISALFVGFSFIPDEYFDFLKAKGSVGDYLIPVLRTQDLLKECRPLVEVANWDQVRIVIDRIINSPNNVKSNLESAVGFLSLPSDRAKARRLVADIVEFIQETDYNTYYEDRLNPSRPRGGAAEAAFVEFSLKSLDTAQSRIQLFLTLFSSDDVLDARKRIESVYN